jgi:hypothetical protein
VDRHLSDLVGRIGKLDELVLDSKSGAITGADGLLGRIDAHFFLRRAL